MQIAKFNAKSLRAEIASRVALPFETMIPGVTVVRQVKRGGASRYRYRSRYGIFLGQTRPGDVAPPDEGDPFRVTDMLICVGMDVRDGEMMVYPTDSAHYEIVPESEIDDIDYTYGDD